MIEAAYIRLKDIDTCLSEIEAVIKARRMEKSKESLTISFSSTDKL